MCSKDNDEVHVMHSKSDNIEIMINNKADEVIEELSQSLSQSTFSITSVLVSNRVGNFNER